MQIRELRSWGESMLEAACIPEADVDVRLLLEKAFGMDYSALLCHLGDPAEESSEEEFRRLVCLRAQRIPLQHILGETTFMGLSFQVKENVLIPRFDTEILVEEVLPFCREADVLDVGTGSGCIAVSLAKLGGCRSVTACDVSEDALSLAKMNAGRNGAEVTFVKSDLFSEISGTFDVIVSNPPYIPTKEIDELAPEVSFYDPRLALDGGEDGLEFYRRLAEEAGAYLRKGGYLAMEIGFDQAAAVTKMLEDHGFDRVRVRKDYAGLDRVVTGRIR